MDNRWEFKITAPGKMIDLIIGVCLVLGGIVSYQQFGINGTFGYVGCLIFYLWGRSQAYTGLKMIEFGIQNDIRIMLTFAASKGCIEQLLEKGTFEDTDDVNNMLDKTKELVMNLDKNIQGLGSSLESHAMRRL